MDPYGDPVVPLTVQYALLSVGGPGAAHGRIRLSGNQLTGTLPAARSRRASSGTLPANGGRQPAVLRLR